MVLVYGTFVARDGYFGKSHISYFFLRLFELSSEIYVS